MGIALLAFEIVAFGSLLYVACKAIYRLHLHPLARYPGPFWAKLSDLHAVFYSIRGESHLKIWRAHKTYGPIVRIGPNKLVFNSPAALHDIYDAKEVQKSIGYTALVTAPGAENIFNLVDKTRHRRKRKIIGQAFSDQAVRSFEPAVQKQLDIFLKQIYLSKSDEDSSWTNPVNLSERAKWLMMDITGEFGFGASFDLQTSTTNRGLVKAVISASKAGGIVGQYPRLRSLRPPKFLSGASSKKPTTFGRVTRTFINNRAQNANANRSWPDLYSFVMGEHKRSSPESLPDIPFDLSELLGESRLLILAGSDTTAAVLAATFFYLSRYPSCLSTLSSQIRDVFPTAASIKSGRALSSLAYLRACLDETMRMSPPVGGALGREVLARGHVIDGTFVPGGIDVGVALYCVHHDEDVFPDSFTYKPERWLETGSDGADRSGSTPEQLASMKRAFNPFSVGSRKCIAQGMAYVELSLAVAKVLWLYDLKMPEGELGRVGGGSVEKEQESGRERRDEFQLYEHFTSIHDGPYLEFNIREEVQEQLGAL